MFSTLISAKAFGRKTDTVQANKITRLTFISSLVSMKYSTLLLCA